MLFNLQLIDKRKSGKTLARSRRLAFESLEQRIVLNGAGSDASDASLDVEAAQVGSSSIVLASFKPLPSLMTVNTTDIDLALQAGLQHLQNILDANNNDLPFFAVWALTRIQSEYYAGPGGSRPNPAHMAFERHLTSNVAGRSLYAILQAADVLGVEVDQHVYESLKSTVLLSLHKPRNGNWNDTAPSNQMVTGLASDPRSYGSLRFDLTHLYNMGAGIRGAVGLATLGEDPYETLEGYEHSSEALMSIAIHNIRKYYVYGGGEIGGPRVYNWESFRYALGLEGGDRFSSSVQDDIVPNWSNLWVGWSDPFLVQILVKYHEATGHQGALNLALELRDNAFYSRFPLNPAQVPFHTFNHGFEVVGAMNAYARLALVTNNSDMMERVRVRYEALRGIGFNATGWSPEWMNISSDVGEANCTAELIETALTFAEWGWTEYYNDVERFTRGHLLPSQLLDTTFIVPNANPQNDGQRDVETRMYGAFGFPAPYGPISTKTPSQTGAYHVDITAGAVATLAEVKRATYQFDDGSHYINMLFDFDNDSMKFVSPYEGKGVASITPKMSGDIILRLPSWVDRDRISQGLTAQGLQFQHLPHHVVISSPTVGQTISLNMHLITQWQTEIINGRELTYRWQGDAVTSMSRMGTPMAFFLDFTAHKDGAVRGDFDQDGDVDGRDFLVWQRAWGSRDPAADANLDGWVDELDLETWQNHYTSSPEMVVSSIQTDLELSFASTSQVDLARIMFLTPEPYSTKTLEIQPSLLGNNSVNFSNLATRTIDSVPNSSTTGVRATAPPLSSVTNVMKNYLMDYVMDELSNSTWLFFDMEFE